MVQAQNCGTAVDEFLSLLRLSPDQLFTLEQNDPGNRGCGFFRIFTVLSLCPGIEDGRGAETSLLLVHIMQRGKDVHFNVITDLSLLCLDYAHSNLSNLISQLIFSSPILTFSQGYRL